MQTVTTIGLDIAKSVFQVHGVDAAGQVIIRRQLRRRAVLAFFQKLPPCRIGIEACASSHHWSRELQALGHTVRFVKRQKNDMADARAICEAVTRANWDSCQQRRLSNTVVSCFTARAIYSSASRRGDQLDPSVPRRVRHCRASRTQRGHGTAACCGRPRATSGCQRLPARDLPRSALNWPHRDCSRKKSGSVSVSRRIFQTYSPNKKGRHFCRPSITVAFCEVF